MLRPYQQQAVTQVLRNWYRPLMPTKRVGIQMPTGSGKTHVASALINEVLWRDSEARVLFIVHTKKIAQQTMSRLAGQGYTLSQVGDGKHSYQGQVVVGIINSLHDCPLVFTHVIVDEAHLFDNARFRRLYCRLSHARYLGLSATYPRKPFFLQRIVHKERRKPLTRQGYLARPVVKHVSADSHRQALAIWQEMAGDRKTIIFANDCNESYLLALYLQSRGIKARHVDGDTHQEDRDWAESNAQVITNVRVYREGADIPGLGCAVLFVDKKQQHHFIQMAGRVLRPDTKDALILCVNSRTHRLEM